jgi:hypothetical protein
MNKENSNSKKERKFSSKNSISKSPLRSDKKYLLEE